MAVATYGQVWRFWPIEAAGSSTDSLAAVAPDQLVFVGEKAGKGIAFRFTLDGSTKVPNAVENGTGIFDVGTVTANNTAIISAPVGGMGQFKGLTQGT